MGTASSPSSASPPATSAATRSQQPPSASSLANTGGFRCERIAPGPDGPLLGVRDTVGWRDEIYLGWVLEPDSCHATRRRRASLVVPGGLPVTDRVSGDALTVLHTVLCDWSSC